MSSTATSRRQCNPCQRRRLARCVGLFALLALGGTWHGALAAGGLAVSDVRCEYCVDPISVDAQRPRLSWVLESDGRGRRQTAYQILVASAAEGLGGGLGDLWDSGKVASGESIQIGYEGKPLGSRQTCWWKVRVWDGEGRASEWSEVGRWTMGLLSPEDWQGKWIAQEAGERVTVSDCQWIWFPEGDPVKAAPVGTRFFRKVFELPVGARIRRGGFVGAADNSFVLYVNGKEAGGSEGWQVLRRLDVAGLVVGGRNCLAIAATNTSTAPNPAGLVGKLLVELDGGRRIEIAVDGTWKAANTERQGWQQAVFDDSAWASARPLGKVGMEPWGMPKDAPRAMPIFRRGFTVDRPVRQAMVYVCGLGQYELRLNGGKVGDHVIDPGWTNYRKRCLYATYDVTSQVRRGGNALGMMLGNGMYNVVGGRYVKYVGSFGPPKLILQLHIDYADGSSTVVGSDETWKVGSGPIIFSCTYGGEDYDAREEQRGWDEPGFGDSAWKSAVVVDGPGGALASQTAPPITVARTLKPVKTTEPKPGVTVYDLGQNFSGRPAITVRGPAGAPVKITPAELLDEAGFASQRSSGGPCTFTYTLRGDGVETWHPRFAYYGFRYLQVEGALAGSAGGGGDGEKAVLLGIEGQFTTSSAEVVGEFACSNALFNRIHEIINWAIRSNMQSVLTDCPHREKLGWLEEAHLMGPSILYNYDVARLYGKIFRDCAEAQLPTGLVPDIAPEYTVFNGGFRDSPEWGSAYVIAPWYVYETYGDVRALEEHYEGMKRYVAYLGTRAKGHIVSHGLGDWCDIGPKPPGQAQLTPTAVTATTIYYYDITILEKVARLLGKTDEADRHAALAREVREAFNRKFFHADTNQYATGSQCSNAMGLVLGLVDSERRAEVLENLVKDVGKHGNHMTAGDVGHRFLILALALGGRSDVVFDMTNQTEAPSYGNQIKHGATSLTEAWDGRAALSQNHFMLGHVEEWFYEYVLGIRQAEGSVGFKEIVIAPQAVGDLTWAKGSYRSVRGSIQVHWKRSDGAFELEVGIPANTRASIRLPAGPAAAIKEVGPGSTGSAVKWPTRREGAEAVCEVGSGRYRFVVEGR
ncbi:MAG: family 78 glycoside hydrolase catalytic domain [Phycisphaerae bacterium]|nr:family 78 glycoside hydrolase catalytic domain [Phycisphaerae bacterium]